MPATRTSQTRRNRRGNAGPDGQHANDMPLRYARPMEQEATTAPSPHHPSSRHSHALTAQTTPHRRHGGGHPRRCAPSSTAPNGTHAGSAPPPPPPAIPKKKKTLPPAAQRLPHSRHRRRQHQRTVDAKHHARRTPRHGAIENVLAPVAQGAQRVLHRCKDAAHGGVDEAGAADHAQWLHRGGGRGSTGESGRGTGGGKTDWGGEGGGG